MLKLFLYITLFLAILGSILVVRSYSELERELKQAKGSDIPVVISHYRNALSWTLPWQGDLSKTIVRDALALLESQDAESRANLVNELKRGVDGSRSSVFANGWRAELSRSLAKLSDSDGNRTLTPLPSFWPNILAQISFLTFIYCGLSLCFRGVTCEGKLTPLFRRYASITSLSLVVMLLSLAMA